MQLDTQSKLSSKTVFLHWVVGVMIIGLLATGIYMEENEVYALYPWHKSFGVLIVLFVIARIAWRIKNGWPAAAGDYTRLEKVLSKLVHYLLIIGTVLLPMSGFMMSAMGGHGVAVFGLELVAANPDPNNPQEMIPLNGSLAGFAHGMHGLGGNILIAAIVLHVVGALKHHIVDKDGTLKRMLGSEI